MHFVVHLLATDCIMTINVITLPYKMVYLDNKLVTATMHGCNYSYVYIYVLVVSWRVTILNYTLIINGCIFKLPCNLDYPDPFGHWADAGIPDK